MTTMEEEKRLDEEGEERRRMEVRETRPEMPKI